MSPSSATKTIVVVAFLWATILFTLKLYNQSDEVAYSRITRKIGSNHRADQESTHSRSAKEEAHHHDSSFVNEFAIYKNRLKNLKEIKISLNNQLRIIEKEKLKLTKENLNLEKKNEQTLSIISRNRLKLRQLEIDLESARKRKYEQNCDTNVVAPIVFNPMNSIQIDEILMTLNHGHITNNVSGSESYTVKTRSAFNFARCPLTRQFKFHYSNCFSANETDTILPFATTFPKSTLDNHFRLHKLHTDDVENACLIICIWTKSVKLTELNSTNNYLLIDLDGTKMISTMIVPNFVSVASPVFNEKQLREKFDVIIPPVLKLPTEIETISGYLPPHSPIQRKYLASYFGTSIKNYSRKFKLGEKVLQAIHRNSIDDLFLFLYDCGMHSKPECYGQVEKLVESSIFNIIFLSNFDNYLDASEMLYVAISKGTIPVIVGDFIGNSARMPFDEVVDWSRVALLVEFARLPELHMILKSISSNDIYRYKYYGSHVFQNYLATAINVFDTILGIYSLHRFHYPPPPVDDIKTVLHQSPEKLHYDISCLTSACIENQSDATNSLVADEILGPREKPVSSPKFTKNFTLVFSYQYELWNNPQYSPYRLYPSYPRDGVAPSEFKFLSPNQSFRPIADGAGGAGLEFSRALGGDFPNEQFTIVLLTYERNNMLMKTLERLKALPYLNKIVVVWNSIRNPPADDLVWPNVGVPLELVKVERNSLNNRFLPYDSIETEAILSLDDDSPLRSDEIVFAFRVWRESRDRIVGFPGRYHAWDTSKASWVYNSNHSCELSMVLTGGAFFHKYYSYMYTYTMPQSIRDIVDKYMNCEDIAMNFLVAHLTREPPIKVTSRWTFHCPGCVNSLSEDESHFSERHECLNLFASIYGYMPLLNTQHRSDSILFKTRLPADKQKCYKFV